VMLGGVTSLSRPTLSRVDTVVKPLVSVTCAWRVKLLTPGLSSGAMNE